MTLTVPPAAAGSLPDPGFTRVEVIAQAGALLASVLDGVRFGHLDDTEAIAVMAALEHLGRKVDGARLRATTDIGARAETDLGSGSLAYRNGCRTRVEFITHLAGISSREARRRLKLGETAVERTPLGLPVPARYAVIADGLASGELGLEAAEIIATTLTALHGRVGPDDVDRVERALVASATGALTPETVGLPGAGICFAPDLLRAQAVEWQARLDPDGTAPNDDAVEARSTLSFGLLRNGLYPLRADVTPELRGIMDTLFNTYLSARSHTPRFRPTDPDSSTDSSTDCNERDTDATRDTERFSDEPFTGDDRFDGDRRTGREKRADILRAIFEATARDPHTPTMGGAAPTVMVHINAADLDHGRGLDRRHRRAPQLPPRHRTHLRRRLPKSPLRHRRRRPLPRHHTPLLQRQTTRRHRRPRRRLHHPRLHHPPTMDRSAPRHRLDRRRPHQHQQRSPTLLVPPPHHPPHRLEHPHHQRPTPNPRPPPLGPHPNLAPRQHPPRQHPQHRPTLATTTLAQHPLAHHPLAHRNRTEIASRNRCES
ncbi:DUF222 domain-containing protein [Cryobacterium sp. PH29-G1]|uniref:DUF222 domain-containing protein n=1 Tax=Cryobacterium sp. PH29-G1 TaxID=3046211 RepID=UPI0024B8C93A|nr:DUF222 domain-containing protein [Cryobacterium sp. PH29-G1]MDJ0347974.1 DUF222 domain-containing protein [Cryobacterium sp. PH29-G1]